MGKLSRIAGRLVALGLVAALSVTALAVEGGPTPSASPGPGRPEDQVQVNQLAIDWCQEKGLMLGNGDSFDPMIPASRAMVAEVLYRLDGGQGEFPTGTFEDVADGVWYGQAVSWAHKQGLMFGTGGNSFSPIRHITRQELACVLYRRAGSPETWQATWQWDWQELDDGEDIAPYARMAVQWGMESYLLPHYYYSDGEHHQYYLPRGTVSRSELAELLYKLYLLNPASYDIDPAEVDFISLNGENPTDKTRLDKPEEIERFIGLLNPCGVKDSLLADSRCGLCRQRVYHLP